MLSLLPPPALTLSVMAACLPASQLFFCAGVDSIRTDTVTAQRQLAYSVGWRAARPAGSAWLKPGQRLDRGFALHHSPLNKPCILSRGVGVWTKWESNWAGNVFGVWEQQSWALTTDFYSLISSLLWVHPAAASFKSYPSYKILV